MLLPLLPRDVAPEDDVVVGMGGAGWCDASELCSGSLSLKYLDSILDVSATTGLVLPLGVTWATFDCTSESVVVVVIVGGGTTENGWVVTGKSIDCCWGAVADVGNVTAIETGNWTEAGIFKDTPAGVWVAVDVERTAWEETDVKEVVDVGPTCCWCCWANSLWTEATCWWVWTVDALMTVFSGDPKSIILKEFQDQTINYSPGGRFGRESSRMLSMFTGISVCS